MPTVFRTYIYVLAVSYFKEWLKDRNKDADVENGLEDTGRGKGKLG